MNLTVMIVEQLDWDAQLRTLRFKPRRGAEFWVARSDEYDHPRSGPFHILEPEQEREFAYKFKQAPNRRSGHFVELGNGQAQFNTEWHGIPTESSGVSCYAICLPQDAVPDIIEFSDPRRTGHLYQHYASYDDQMGRVVCYLECRSRYGAFDFDLHLEFHRDARACRSFEAVTGGPEVNDFKHIAEWIGSERDKVLIQQFFDYSSNISAGDGSQILRDSVVEGPVVTAGAAGIIGAIGDNARGHAKGSAGSQHNVSVPTAHNDGKVRLVNKARSSIMVRVLGVVTLAVALIATVLVFLGITNIAIAGYAVALISLVAAAIPLFRD
jgi:hypothetical protein